MSETQGRNNKSLLEETILSHHSCQKKPNDSPATSLRNSFPKKHWTSLGPTVISKASRAAQATSKVRTFCRIKRLWPRESCLINTRPAPLVMTVTQRCGHPLGMTLQSGAETGDPTLTRTAQLCIHLPPCSNSNPLLKPKAHLSSLNLGSLDPFILFLFSVHIN